MWFTVQLLLHDKRIAINNTQTPHTCTSNTVKPVAICAVEFAHAIDVQDQTGIACLKCLMTSESSLHLWHICDIREALHGIGLLLAFVLMSKAFIGFLRSESKHFIFNIFDVIELREGYVLFVCQEYLNFVKLNWNICFSSKKKRSKGFGLHVYNICTAALYAKEWWKPSNVHCHPTLHLI